VTPSGIVGATNKYFKSDDWVIGVSYPVVRPDLTVYKVTLSSLTLGWHWAGNVKADGTVTEISAFKQMSEEESRKVAEEFVKNSPTFVFDGMADTLTLVDTLTARCPYCWVFIYEFDTSHAGYGDRTGQMLAQVITHHRVSIAIEQLEVKSATIDDAWDMILQQETGISVPPHSGVPAAPNDSIVTARVIDILDGSGDFPCEAVIEIQTSEDVPGYINATVQRIGERITVKTSEDISHLKVGQIIRANVKLEGDEQNRFYLAENIAVVPATAGALEGVTWILEYYGEQGSLNPVLEGTRITAIFNSAERQVNGSAGCNSYFGGYQVADNELAISQVGHTEMACLEPEGVMEQEQDYIKLLQTAESFQIQDGKLQINCGWQVLVYTAG